MIKKLNDFHFNHISNNALHIFCLALVGLPMTVGIAFNELCYGSAIRLALYCSIAAAFLFFGMTVRQEIPKLGRNLLLLGLVVCGWNLLIQLYDLRGFTASSYDGSRLINSTFLCEYLLLLPYAAVQRERNSASGLKVIGLFFLAGSLLLCLFSILYCVNLPPQELKQVLSWRGRRLWVQWHPNIMAVIFMVGIGFCLSFIYSEQKWWLKVLVGLSIAIQAATLILTNSRTGILMTAVMVLGTIFFSLYKGNPKPVKILLIVALVIIIAVFAFYYITNDSHNYFLTQISSAAEEKAAAARPKPTELQNKLDDLFTFNGRTQIWKAILKGIIEEPKVLLFGTEYQDEFIARHFSLRVVEHSHNSWFNALLSAGLPGLLLALYVTWLSLKAIWTTLFQRRYSPVQKSIAMLTFSMLCAGSFEPQLFYSQYTNNFLQLAFMICTGYLISWTRLPREEAIDSSLHASKADSR